MTVAPLLHIGLHKTGTTWLQEGLFAPQAGAFEPMLSAVEAVHLLVRPHPFEWRGGEVATRLHELADASCRTGRIPVLSCEALSGNPHTGGWWSGLVADRLAEALPQARILIVVRRQAEMLASTWRQFVLRGGTRSAPRYLREDPQRRLLPGFRFGHFEYDRLVEAYQGRFGPAQVKVLAFERLRSDPEGFVAEIVRFAEAPPHRGPLPPPANRGLSALALACLRRGNRLLRRDELNPAAPVRIDAWPHLIRRLDDLLLRRLADRAEQRLAECAAAAAEGRFAASNARLAARTGLDLAALGYELPPASAVDPGV